MEDCSKYEEGTGDYIYCEYMNQKVEIGVFQVFFPVVLTIFIGVLIANIIIKFASKKKK